MRNITERHGFSLDHRVFSRIPAGSHTPATVNSTDSTVPLMVRVVFAGALERSGSPVEGLIRRSPNGTTCVKIGIDTVGGMTTQTVADP